jgi:hypothetical protein
VQFLCSHCAVAVQFGIASQFIRHRYVNALKSLYNRCAVVFLSLICRLAIASSSLDYRFAITCNALQPLRNRLTSALHSICNRCAIDLLSLCYSFAVALESLWNCFRTAIAPSSLRYCLTITSQFLVCRLRSPFDSCASPPLS